MKQSEPQNILIVRFSSIGDIVLATPLVRALRTRFPDARLDFVLKQEFAELLDTNPYMTTVHAYDPRTGLKGLFELAEQLRNIHYDVFVDIHNNYRSYFLRLLARPGRIVSYSKQILPRTLLVKMGINRYKEILQMPERYLKPLHSLGVVNDTQGLELFPTEAHRAKVASIFRQASLTDNALAIGFGPLAAHLLKQWPLERFVALGQQLAEKYHARMLLFGGARDVQQVAPLIAGIPNHPIDLCGKLSLLETAAALQRCQVFVGNDTGTIHLAAAMQRPVVAIFGPTVEEFGFYPYRTPDIVVSKPLPCRPCTHTGKGRCKIGTHACMREIQVTDVLNAVERSQHFGSS